MSRITSRAAIGTLDSLSASDLNTRFDDFETAFASNSVNEYNVRDGSIDLPQLATQQICKSSGEAILGPGDFDLATNLTTITAYDAASPPPWTTPVPITDPTAANDSRLEWASGLSMVSGDILEVWWNLNVQAIVGNHSTLNTAGSLSRRTYPDGAGGVVGNDGQSVWVFYLEWDQTSNALANWVPVPGQTSYDTSYGGSDYGGPLTSSQSAAFACANIVRANGLDSTKITTVTSYSTDWETIQGFWIHLPSGDRTIYGLRVVVKHGLFHPAQDGSGNDILLADPEPATGGNVDLKWQSGIIGYSLRRTA